MSIINKECIHTLDNRTQTFHFQRQYIYKQLGFYKDIVYFMFCHLVVIHEVAGLKPCICDMYKCLFIIEGNKSACLAHICTLLAKYPWNQNKLHSLVHQGGNMYL